MAKDQKQVLIDTNLLIYFYIKKSPKYKIIKDLVVNLANESCLLAVAQQSLLEFYSVITSKKRVEKPVSFRMAQKEIANYYQNGFFKIISPIDSTFNIFLKIINRRRIKGGNIFDFYLAATALSNKIRIIYTENVKDFRDIEGLKIINPFK